MARMWEHLGNHLETQRLAGVLVVEATKLVYVPPLKEQPQGRRIHLDTLVDVVRPKPRPATGCIAAEENAP